MSTSFSLGLDFLYTDHFAVNGSEVVDEVFYNRVSEELALVFVSGSVRVYTEFPEYRYQAFSAHVERGLSAGGFYNTFIKGEYNSENGDDLSFVETVTPVSLPDTAATDVQFESTGDRYSVTYSLNGADTTNEFATRAGSESEAVDSLSELLVQLGLAGQVVSVTHYFD